MASPNPGSHASVVPSEVGWQFVPQYYTYMNKQPSRLHCFYTKNSTFIHGTEGEDIKPCFGQQEIHNKILSIGFTDCKVFIHSVDAQSSSNGGIIIQVIGEMSNNSEAWRKFAQTFFLAEQPNGYFVLNDIFRYLKEESVEAEEGDGEASGPQHQPAEFERPTQPVVDVSPHDSGPVPVESTAVELSPVPEPSPEPITKQPAVNGTAPDISQHLSTEQDPAEVQSISVVPEVESSVDEQHATVEAAPERPKTPEPTLEPVTAPAPPVPVQSAPAPSIPVAPKTWANLAAANSNKWGNAVAQDVKGVSAAAAAAAAPTASPVASGTTTPIRDGYVTPNRGQRGENSPAYQAAMLVTTAQCFLKGVTEVVSHNALVSTLTTRFGPVKDVEIVRSKACAFLEFISLDAARRAIIASLPMSQGGQGGVRIDVEAGQARITVETRKERGERPISRPRGGAPGIGDNRGGFRGRGGPGSRGRGIGPGPANGGAK